jgi:replicative DNA helicase
MGKMTWQNELKRFERLEKIEKLHWLAALQFSLTLLGRSAYVAGSYAVSDPALLRKLNEFFHRIASYQLKLLNPSTGTLSAADATAMIEECRQEINVDGEFILRSMNRSDLERLR